MKIMKKSSILFRSVGLMLIGVMAVATQPSFAGETASGAGFERKFSDEKMDSQKWQRSAENRIQDLLDKQAITEVIYHLGRSLDRSVYRPEAIEEHPDPEFPVL